MVADGKPIQPRAGRQPRQLFDGREHRVHILCYYPDDCEALARHTAVMDKRRYDAVYQSCKELEEICPQFKT